MIHVTWTQTLKIEDVPYTNNTNKNSIHSLVIKNGETYLIQITNLHNILKIEV